MSAKAFIEKIKKVPGLQKYILVRRDGKTVAHNVENEKKLADFVVFNGLSSDALKSSLELKAFQHYILTKNTKEKVFIFRIGNYYLGVFQDKDAFTPDFKKAIEAEIKQLMTKKEAA